MARASLADELMMSMLPPELAAALQSSTRHMEAMGHRLARGMRIACERGCLVGVITDEGCGQVPPVIELDLSQSYVGPNSIGQLCVPMEMLDLQQLLDVAISRRSRRRTRGTGPFPAEMLRQPVFSGRCRCCGGRFFQPVFQHGGRTGLKLHTDRGWRGT